MTVVTRFAPSPTGVLHTGSARTALFCWLYARKHNGKFLLRIEDTDIERSKKEHEDRIIADLKWLGLEWDGDVIHQLARRERHKEVAYEMIKRGAAYKCYVSAEEIEAFREKNPNQKFVSPYRDNPVELDKPYAIRLKVDHGKSTKINDLIMGEIIVENSELDDMIMLRSDGTPTYMLAVVVDDHDMAVTHIIRGDDHLTNAFRQKQIYLAMNWVVPEFAHIPLIHDKDGQKLSKRKGALGVEEYKAQGFLPDAVFNHLLRLGWSHGNDEIISRVDAINWFDLEHVGKSPARFDYDKLLHINAHYLRQMADADLYALVKDKVNGEKIEAGVALIKNRVNTILELAEGLKIFNEKHSPLDEKSQEILKNLSAETVVKIKDMIQVQTDWSKDALSHAFAPLGEKPAFAMQALRALLVGTFASPGIYDVMSILGKEECLRRLP